MQHYCCLTKYWEKLDSLPTWDSTLTDLVSNHQFQTTGMTFEVLIVSRGWGQFSFSDCANYVLVTASWIVMPPSPGTPPPLFLILCYMTDVRVRATHLYKVSLLSWCVREKWRYMVAQIQLLGVHIKRFLLLHWCMKASNTEIPTLIATEFTRYVDCSNIKEM